MPSSKLNSQPKRSLSPPEQLVIRELLSLMPDAVTGVDVSEFRATHRASRRLLDDLRQEHLLRDEQGRYFVPITAIALLGSSESEGMLDDADALYALIQHRYGENPKERIRVSELALSAGVNDSRARQVLSYMFGANTGWIQSQPNDILTNPDATLVAADGVFDFDDFRSVVTQVEDWRTTGPYVGMLASADETLPPLGPGTSAGFVRPAAGAPDWVLQLPDGPREVMGEVYSAATIGLRALPAMGIRTALDLLFTDVLGGDRGTFEAKVKLLSGQGFFSAADEPHVIAVIEAGNAAAHRGHIPDDVDLGTMCVFAERLLYARYIQAAALARLATNTPPRSSKPPRQQKTP